MFHFSLIITIENFLYSFFGKKVFIMFYVSMLKFEDEKKK